MQHTNSSLLSATLHYLPPTNLCLPFSPCTFNGVNIKVCNMVRSLQLGVRARIDLSALNSESRQSINAFVLHNMALQCSNLASVIDNKVNQYLHTKQSYLQKSYHHGNHPTFKYCQIGTLRLNWWCKWTTLILSSIKCPEYHFFGQIFVKYVDT